MADAGAAAAPGLEQEFFDVADAFSKWCNAAGGINGRKIVVTKLDAKLFNGAAQVINACQTEFMLVGGGNAFDAPDVKPRIACKLGQIPAYAVSPEASNAGLQVTPGNSIPTEYQIGTLRLLAEAYPVAKQGLGIGTSNVASLIPQGKRAQQAAEAVGYRVTDLQEKPPIVTNFRPYMEQLKSSGAKAYNDQVSQDPTPEIVAASDVGWKPVFVNFSTINYDPKTVAAAKATAFPPTYIGLASLPFELSDKYPVLQLVKSIMSAGVSNPKYTTFSAIAFNAWTLWAKSASECGVGLTQACVLQKAARYTAWTGGGLFAPLSTIPGKQHLSDCVAIVRLTPNGFVYDKAVTKPNQGIYNCDPRNVAKVNSFG
jgi:ABC-type branched-subunit amino acid transport system substrate-binding protein